MQNGFKFVTERPQTDREKSDVNSDFLMFNNSAKFKHMRDQSKKRKKMGSDNANLSKSLHEVIKEFGKLQRKTLKPKKISALQSRKV
jgi:hypothetical protein